MRHRYRHPWLPSHARWWPQRRIGGHGEIGSRGDKQCKKNMSVGNRCGKELRSDRLCRVIIWLHKKQADDFLFYGYCKNIHLILTWLKKKLSTSRLTFRLQISLYWGVLMLCIMSVKRPGGNASALDTTTGSLPCTDILRLWYSGHSRPPRRMATAIIGIADRNPSTAHTGSTGITHTTRRSAIKDGRRLSLTAMVKQLLID